MVRPFVLWRCPDDEGTNAPMDESEFPFERLEVFQLAMQLAPIIQAIVRRLPPGFGDLRDHIRRSERSIRLNISEGSGKRPARMKAARYDTARASANECAAASQKLGYSAWPTSARSTRPMRCSAGSPAC